jgi:hypothetical protein
VDFRILGPLEVRDGDRRVEVGGPEQRSLLVLLLLHANCTGLPPPPDLGAEACSSMASSAASWGEEALYKLKVRPAGGRRHGIADRRSTMAGP